MNYSKLTVGLNRSEYPYISDEIDYGALLELNALFTLLIACLACTAVCCVHLSRRDLLAQQQQGADHVPVANSG